MEEDTPPIFDHCVETSSQKEFLRHCGFARQSDHQGSHLPQQNDRNDLPDAPESSEKSVADTDQIPNAEGTNAASDLEQNVVDRNRIVHTVNQLGSNREDDSRVLQNPKPPSENQPMSSMKRKGESMKSPVKETEKSKLKIPLREVVKAIVMNSMDERNTEKEGEEEIGKMSCVQILMTKGFKFPGA